MAPYIGGSFLQEALEMEMKVFKQRKERLGKEHHYTLAAMVIMAQIKSKIGDQDEAEQLLLTGLLLAQTKPWRSALGSVLNEILVRQGRYEEAENMLLEVVELQRNVSLYRGDYHPDRIGQMLVLVRCYEGQGKIAESLKWCNEALVGFEKISRTEHGLAKIAKEDQKRLMALLDGTLSTTVMEET
ncbi:hypothetical protein MMC08_005498 [Hypocenomyce scalaris]|nr:hypothetical protein [Hypocenomyce scalaris]